jgi:hypothetical protein
MIKARNQARANTKLSSNHKPNHLQIVPCACQKFFKFMKVLPLGIVTVIIIFDMLWRKSQWDVRKF